MTTLQGRLLGEVARQPQTAEELAERVGVPFVFVRSALTEVCWDQRAAVPDGKGRWSPATPAQVMALQSVG